MLHILLYTHACAHTDTLYVVIRYTPGMGLYGLLVENCRDTVNICSSAGSDTDGDRLSSCNHMVSADKQSIDSLRLTNCS